MEDYIVLGRIGEGAHGIVMKASQIINITIDNFYEMRERLHIKV